LTSAVGVLAAIEDPRSSIYLQAQLLNRLLERQYGVRTEMHATKRVALAKLWFWIGGDRPIIVHYGSFGLAAFKLSRRKRTWFVYHNHTPFRFYWKWEPLVMLLDLCTELQLRLLPRNTSWIAVSAFNAARLKELGFRSVKECPLIVDASAPKADSRFQKSVIPTVIYVGRISPHKQCVELISEVGRAAKVSGGRVRLEVVGDGKPASRYLRAFEETVAAAQVAGDLELVWYRDPLPATELRARYERAWLYLSLSRHEGFGLPACEAILAGTPSLYLECGGQEAVLEGVGVVPLERRCEFATRVAELLQDETARQRLWTDQLAVASRYCVDSVAPQVADAYGELLEEVHAGFGS
jgi:glycosyltransferase involved in cell wall biosynthesis